MDTHVDDKLRNLKFWSHLSVEFQQFPESVVKRQQTNYKTFSQMPTADTGRSACRGVSHSSMLTKKIITMDYDFAELKNDVNFVTNVKTATEAIKSIENTIDKVSEIKLEDLSADDKVKHDIFLAYAINSLFWMYLKINGENPNTVSRQFSQF